jgi:hypothetical protein
MSSILKASVELIVRNRRFFELTDCPLNDLEIHLSKALGGCNIAYRGVLRDYALLNVGRCLVVLKLYLPDRLRDYL